MDLITEMVTDVTLYIVTPWYFGTLLTSDKVIYVNIGRAGSWVYVTLSTSWYPLHVWIEFYFCLFCMLDK